MQKRACFLSLSDSFQIDLLFHTFFSPSSYFFQAHSLFIIPSVFWCCFLSILSLIIAHPSVNPCDIRPKGGVIHAPVLIFRSAVIYGNNNASFTLLSSSLLPFFTYFWSRRDEPIEPRARALFAFVMHIFFTPQFQVSQSSLLEKKSNADLVWTRIIRA